MARAKVVHSTDGVEIVFRGDRSNPEPTVGVISFPGGDVEVSRCSDGSYWTHIRVDDPQSIVGSRMDYSSGAAAEIKKIPQVPRANEITHIAVRINVNAGASQQ